MFSPHPECQQDAMMLIAASLSSDATVLIAAMPDFKPIKGIDNNVLQREKLIVYSNCIKKMFKRFNEASYAGCWFQCPDGIRRFGYPLVVKPSPVISYPCSLIIQLAALSHH